MDGTIMGVIARATSQKAAIYALYGRGIPQRVIRQAFREIQGKREQRTKQKRTPCFRSNLQQRLYYGASLSDYEFPRLVCQRILDWLWVPNSRDFDWKFGDGFDVLYTSRVTGTYRGNYRTFQKKAWTIHFTLPRNYLQRRVEIDFTDGIALLILSRRRIGEQMEIIHGLRCSTSSRVKGFAGCMWVAKEGEIAYHGKTLREAITGLRKKSARMLAIPALTMETRITRGMYRKLTGACKAGVDAFCRDMGWEDKEYVTVEELLRHLYPHHYGYAVFMDAVNRGKGE